jgi:hypothetical protein
MKRTIFALFLLLFFILIHTACREKTREVIETEPISFNKEGELLFFTAGTDTAKVQLDIEIADNDYETQTGLMYRDAMTEHQGMLFVFPEEAMHSFYMKNTKIPLDILFIGSNQKIASITANAEPYNESGISSRLPVKYVLEINAGLVARWGLQLGDSISFSKN